MGLNNRVFELLVEHCGREPNRRALIAGWPNWEVTDGKALGLLGNKPIGPREAFETLGYDTMDVVDIDNYEGANILHDLNHPYPIYSETLHNYDLVLDHGTIEHCFNIAQAAVTLASAVKESGLIVQHLPMNCLNHGFYNLNPTWFYSFYKDNGFRILAFEAIAWGSETGFEVPKHQDFQVANLPPTLLTMVARREEKRPFRFPVQRRYQGIR